MRYVGTCRRCRMSPRAACAAREFLYHSLQLAVGAAWREALLEKAEACGDALPGD